MFLKIFEQLFAAKLSSMLRILVKKIPKKYAYHELMLLFNCKYKVDGIYTSHGGWVISSVKGYHL